MTEPPKKKRKQESTEVLQKVTRHYIVRDNGVEAKKEEKRTGK